MQSLNLTVYEEQAPISLRHFFHPFIIPTSRTFIKKKKKNEIGLYDLTFAMLMFYHKQTKTEKVLIGEN